MEEHNAWVFFKKIDWHDPKFNRFNVDTRDFHCGYTFNAETHTDIATLEKSEKSESEKDRRRKDALSSARMGEKDTEEMIGGSHL